MCYNNKVLVSLYLWEECNENYYLNMIMRFFMFYNFLWEESVYCVFNKLNRIN